MYKGMKVIYRGDPMIEFPQLKPGGLYTIKEAIRYDLSVEHITIVELSNGNDDEDWRWAQGAFIPADENVLRSIRIEEKLDEVLAKLNKMEAESKLTRNRRF